jgi:hypothetical protein
MRPSGFPVLKNTVLALVGSIEATAEPNQIVAETNPFVAKVRWERCRMIFLLVELAAYAEGETPLTAQARDAHCARPHDTIAKDQKEGLRSFSAHRWHFSLPITACRPGFG